MVVIYWLVALALLTQGCTSSLGQTEVGCKTWRQNGHDVCCDECHPGNRLIKLCGPRPKELCRPCEPGTFTLDPRNYRCSRCSQCVGAQVHLKDCTIKSDTQCGCQDGLVCGDEKCSFCVEKCAQGYEPTDNYSCRLCPHGTFNNKSHEKCKPWSTKCPDPNQVIVAKGNASSDIQCQVTVEPVETKAPDHADPLGPMVLYEVIISVMVVLFIATTTIIIIIIMAVKVKQNRKKAEKQPEPQRKKTPIIRTPTDDPRTLIAIECSFHEAQQEQGSSTESLIKVSSEEFTA